MVNSVLNSGVTIITSTIRQQCIHNIFSNYNRQAWHKKELIIILNKDSMNIDSFKKLASKYPNVRIYRQPEKQLLGGCLNYATSIARYPYIAKFDDDDYYGAQYLSEAMNLFAKTDADVVGKRSCFFYLPHRSVLLYRKVRHTPYSRCKKIAGATIMYNKRVFHDVKFSKVRLGTDVRFVKACLDKGCKVYTSSRFHFTAIRRKNSKSHTWKITDRQLLTNPSTVAIRTKSFRKFVNGSVPFKGLTPKGIV